MGGVALSREVVARVARAVADEGPAPGLRYMAHEDFAALRGALLVGLPAGESLWIFAYGSLLWNPCFPVAEERFGTARGWHRRFCLWLTRWRGTRAQPGLMLALDRGGSCRGVLYRIASENRQAALQSLLEREMGATPATNVPRWLAVDSEGQTIRAIAFVADPAGPAYAAPLPDEKLVPVLALAAGHLGSCADYLCEAISSLERRGIRDRNLWRLQAKVAAFIAGLPPGQPLPVYRREVDHACEG